MHQHWKRYNKVGSVTYMGIITSALYPLCIKRKQAIALLPTLSEKHRRNRCLFAQFNNGSGNINIHTQDISYEQINYIH